MRRSRRWTRVPAKIAEHAEVAGARSALALAQEGRAGHGAACRTCKAAAAADPDDFQARYDLATALNATRRARAGGRGAARHHQAQPRLERRRRAAAAAEVLRGLGVRRPGHHGLTPQAVGAAVQLDGGRSTPAPRTCRPNSRSSRCRGPAAAPRQAAAEHLRAALPGHGGGRAGRRPHVRHDPAGPAPCRRANRPGPVPHRLPGPAVVVQRDR